MKRMFVLGVIGTVVLALAACRVPPGVLDLEEVATGFDKPLFLTAPPKDRDRLFVVEQGGGIWIVKDDGVVDEPFLDISGQVGSEQGERGLLGLAFHPGFDENGFFFVNYTNNDLGTTISRFSVSDDPDRADPASETIIMEFDQPFANHNGGMLAFGPDDGYLYIGTGDGGSANDPNDSAQNLDTRLGKILRIDVDSGDPFSIPEDNPFAGGKGEVNPEIWAYGLRNPWRFSFDRETGDLWIGDVGQSRREEIDFEPADSPGGVNYGWRVFEGTRCNTDVPAVNSAVCETLAEDTVFPIHEYDQPLAQSVTGGYVYRGTEIPGLQGTYFFADFISGEVWSFRLEAGQVTEFMNRTDDLQPRGLVPGIASFGEDAAGELYIVDRNNGNIFKIVAGPLL